MRHARSDCTSDAWSVCVRLWPAHWDARDNCTSGPITDSQSCGGPFVFVLCLAVASASVASPSVATSVATPSVTATIAASTIATATVSSAAVASAHAAAAFSPAAVAASLPSAVAAAVSAACALLPGLRTHLRSTRLGF